MKKFLTTSATVVTIAAGLLLAVSGPTFAAKRTLQKSDTKSAVKSQSRAVKFPIRIAATRIRIAATTRMPPG